MKPIERPNWINGYNGHLEKSDLDWLNKWFTENIEPINAAIENGVEVYGYDKQNWQLGPHYGGKTGREEISTHKALLINIEPIKQETREEEFEKILTDLVKRAGDYGLVSSWIGDVLIRAKAALEREGKK